MRKHFFSETAHFSFTAFFNFITNYFRMTHDNVRYCNSVTSKKGLSLIIVATRQLHVVEKIVVIIDNFIFRRKKQA